MENLNIDLFLKAKKITIKILCVFVRSDFLKRTGK
jgi:hypothetical protein